MNKIDALHSRRCAERQGVRYALQDIQVLTRKALQLARVKRRLPNDELQGLVHLIESIHVAAIRAVQHAHAEHCIQTLTMLVWEEPAAVRTGPTARRQRVCPSSLVPGRTSRARR